MCAECKNSPEPSLHIMSEQSTGAFTAEPVKDGRPVDFEAAEAVDAVGTMGELGRMPFEVRGDPQGSRGLVACQRCGRV